MRRWGRPAGQRDALAAELRRLIAALPSLAAESTCPWPVELAALEAGERVICPGWAVGLDARNFSLYWLEADDSLTPYIGAKKKIWDEVVG